MAWSYLSGTASANKTGTQSVVAGHLLVVAFACGDGTSSPTISDGVNTWTQVTGSPQKDAGNGAGVAMWSAIAATTASITVTVTATATTFNGTDIAEYSGNAAASVNDGGIGANIAGSTATDGQKTGSFTPAVNGDLVVSFINDDQASDTSTLWTAGTGYSKRACKDPGGTSETTYAYEDIVQVTAAAINPSWTAAVSHSAVGIGAAFKAGPTSIPNKQVIVRQAVNRVSTY